LTAVEKCIAGVIGRPKFFSFSTRSAQICNQESLRCGVLWLSQIFNTVCSLSVVEQFAERLNPRRSSEDSKSCCKQQAEKMFSVVTNSMQRGDSVQLFIDMVAREWIQAGFFILGPEAFAKSPIACDRQSVLYTWD
jgi:hypothetical protein